MGDIGDPIRQILIDLGLRNPDIGVCPDGRLLFCWDKGSLHFECDVFVGHSEWFFIDHATNEMWEYSHVIGTPMPDDVMAYVRRFW